MTEHDQLDPLEDENSEVASDSSRPQKLLEVASHCLKTGLYTDVTFIVGERKFPAHRLVMDSISDYFKSLFKAKVYSQGEVIIENVSAESFQILLDFAYNGRVEITFDNVSRLLLAADYFTIDFIREWCMQHIVLYINIENVCDVIMFALEHNLHDLLDSAIGFLKKNVDGVSKNDTFSSLEPKFLSALFNDDNLILYNHNIPLKPLDSEKLLLEVIMRYITLREKKNKTFDAKTLLGTVRWPILNEKTIVSCLHNLPNFAHCDVINKFVQLSNPATRFSDLDIAKVKETWMKPRHILVSLHSSNTVYAIKENVLLSCINVDFNNEISRVDIWTRRWDGRPVIGKIKVVYRNVNTPDEVLEYSQGDGKSSIGHESLDLRPGEFITKVVVKSGKVIDNLYFETNMKQKLGPCGGPGGDMAVEKGEDEMSSYLYDISCCSELTLGATAICNLMLRWVTFKVKDT
ncbi:kelch-like protein 12 isoform X2 [Biomphalaria glabrata]|uniref:Kelch-like protein 12 isoform X2 n=1 Tax=Biomphalaria glabrata TaxID=6526 RepID=A0A9W3BFQ1_BIOGL|nr:kelch-like protein 12 isoform X2 [Biomphalaria glabrata]